MKFFVVLTSAVQNLFMFEDVTLELVGDVCFAKLENVSVVNLLIFNVHLSIEESWKPNKFHTSGKNIQSNFFDFFVHCSFLGFFVMILKLLMQDFVTTIFDQYQFQS